MRAISTHGLTTAMTTGLTAVGSAAGVDDSNCSTASGDTLGRFVAPSTPGNGSVAGFACPVAGVGRAAWRHSATKTPTKARTNAQAAMRAVRRCAVPMRAEYYAGLKIRVSVVR